MSSTFQNFSDCQLCDFLDSNCPEGKLSEAVDEMIARMGFYQMIVTEMANQGGMTLEEFLEYFEGDEEDDDLENMSMDELQQRYAELVEEKQRKDLIDKIKQLTKD